MFFVSSIITFQSFQMPNEINLMEHCLIVEQTVTECNFFFFAKTSALMLSHATAVITAWYRLGSFLLNTVERNQKKKKNVSRKGNISMNKQIHTSGWS